MTETTSLSRRQAFRANPVILAATTNPKKAGSMSHERFQGYFAIDWSKPQTVGSVLDGRVVRMDDIMHDMNKGFIIVGVEEIKAHEKAAEVAQKKAIADAKKLLASVEA
jgi:hypothetical protein